MVVEWVKRWVRKSSLAMQNAFFFFITTLLDNGHKHTPKHRSAGGAI